MLFSAYSQGNSARLKVALLALFSAAFFASIPFGFYSLFANFRAYDDEGILLLGSKLFLENVVFYKDVIWIYGPGQLAGIRILHDWLGVPISHSAVRFITLGYWLVLCCVSASLIYKISRSAVWAITTFVLVLLYTTSIVNEPGHPQSLITLLILLVPLVLVPGGTAAGKIRWFTVAALAACVFFIKVNAGLYLIAAIAIVILGQAHSERWRLGVSVSLIVLSFAFPFVLMFPLLSEPGCIELALLCATTLAAVAAIASIRSCPGFEFSAALKANLLGFALVTVAALFFTWLNGASVVDIFKSLMSYSGNQKAFYHFFSEFSKLQIFLAFVALFTAICCRFGTFGQWADDILALAKLYFCVVSFYLIFRNTPENAHLLFAYAGPWCWVVVFADKRSLPRLMLASIAAWSPLLVYPIPGSQVYFGCVPLLLAAVLCSGDLVVALVERFPRAQALTKTVPLLLCLGASVLFAIQFSQARHAYYENKALNLPGTQFMRIEPGRVREYRALVKRLNQADVALTTFRSNSLYFWSSAKMPGALYHAHSVGYALNSEQSKIIADLSRASHPVVISRVLPAWVNKPPESAISRWLDKNFQFEKKIGQFRVFKPVAGFPLQTKNE